jgi:hypothetical protein
MKALIPIVGKLGGYIGIYKPTNALNSMVGKLAGLHKDL